MKGAHWAQCVELRAVGVQALEDDSPAPDMMLALNQLQYSLPSLAMVFNTCRRMVL
jgi:hypothetical protein